MSDPLSKLADAAEDDDALEKELERELNLAGVDDDTKTAATGDDGKNTKQEEDDLFGDAHGDLKFEADNVINADASHKNSSMTANDTDDDDEGGREKINRSMSNQSDSSAKIDVECFTDTQDLCVVVDKPEKLIKTMESYVIFNVNTKTTRSDFENPEYSVKRRYNDFLWLRQKLEEAFPHLIIPPLPEKHNLTIDRFDKEFLRFREVALHRFMGRLAHHPVLSLDKNLMSFLTLDSIDFQSHKKIGTGILSRVSKSLTTMSGSYMLKNRQEEYTNMYDFAQRLVTIMGALDRIAQRLGSEQTDYLSSMENYVAGFCAWSEGEEQIGSALSAMTQLYDDMQKDFRFMADENALKLTLPLKEYILYCDSIKGTLARRDTVEHDFEVIDEELEKCNAEKNQVQQVKPFFTVTLASGEQTSVGGILGRGSSEEAKQAKATKLDARIKELLKLHDYNKSRMEKANEAVKSDMARWHHRKKIDMKELFGGLAQRNITVYDKHISVLENTLTLIKDSMNR